MNKKLHLKLKHYLLAMAIMVNALVWAQPAIDASGQFEPAITQTAVVYSSGIINTTNANAAYDIAFTLSDVPMTDYNFFASAHRFVKNNGYIDVRNGTVYVPKASLANEVALALNTKYRVWTVIDVPNKRYSTYVKTDAMPSPVLIFENAGFRKTTTTAINYWSAVHNSQGDPTGLTIHDVQLVSAMGEFPVSYTDATLKSLSISSGTLVPSFNANTTTYTVSLPKGTKNVDVSGIANFLGAKVAGNGLVDVSTGTAVANVVVTADDGITQNSYTINFSVMGNYALSLPGGNDGNFSNVAIPALNITTLPVTIEMWYKPDVTQNYYATLWYNRGASSNSGVQYDRWGDVSKIKGVWNNNAGTGLSTEKPIPGKWNHVALVITPTTKILYINGVPFEQPGTYTNYPFDGITHLGWDRPNADLKDRTLKGLIDEFRLWNVARTPQQLEQYKHSVLMGNEPGLLGYWNFDDKAAMATDLTSNAKHGTINGGTYVLSFDASDDDGDGILAYLDNCPDTSNPDQTDGDGDGIGDVCDDDWDNDGISNSIDNCPYTYNPDQTDLDEDGIGDICDPEVPAGLNFAMMMPGGSDGSLSNIDISGLNLKTLPYTIEMWVKPTANQVDNTGLIYHRGTGNAGIQFTTGWQGSGKLRFMSNAGSADYGTLSSVTVSNNEWHHVAVVLTGTTSTLYLDGVQYSRSVISPVYDFSTGKLYIGWDSGAANRAFKGVIDEVRIWNVARSSSDLLNTMFTPLNGNEQGLLAYYNFEDRNQTRVTCLTPTGVHGVISGGTYILSSVFDPMKFVSASLSQSISEVNAPSVNNVVGKLVVNTTNQNMPLSLTSLHLSANGTTSLEGIKDVAVYYTGSSNTFSTAQKVGSLNGSPEGLTFEITGNQLLKMGANYFWITYDVNKGVAKGSILDVECSQITLLGAESQDFVPNNVAAEGHLVVNADAFIGQVKLPVSVVTSNAASSIEGANFASFQQNAIMTYNGYQYVTYWNKTSRVCIARKKLPLGNWEVLELSAHTVAPSRVTDNHYTISMGICANDGTIHISYDHHNDGLRYQKSVVGLANEPEKHPWTNASFGPKLDYLVQGVPVSNVTYPRFIAKPNGDLLFECRLGWSGNGDDFIWEYSASTGLWTYIGEYLNGTSVSENAYINGIHYDKTGNLHVSWVWRQTPDAQTNHDVYYAYSNNDGRSWYNAAGTKVAEVPSGKMVMSSPGLKVWNVSTQKGLINQESQAVDSKGGIHILQSYIPDGVANTGFWDSRINNGQLRHIYRDENGVWQNDVVAPSTRNRSEIAVDEGDNVYVVAPNYRIYFASAAEKWKKWTVFDISEASGAINEGLIDRESLLNESVLSFVFAHSDNDGKIIVPYYLIDKSKEGTGTGLNVSVFDGEGFESLISQSLNAVNVLPADIVNNGEKTSLSIDGTLETFFAEQYTLYFTTTGESKVFINDVQVLSTGVLSSETTYPIMLNLQPSHKYSIRIEGTHNSNNVVAKLEWESERQERQLVPVSALYGKLNDIPSSIADIKTNLNVNYYPNPFKDAVTVRVNGEFNYFMYDINGALVESGKAINNGAFGNQLPKGVYTLKIEQKGVIKAIKLIKL